MGLVWGTLSHENILPLLGICEVIVPTQGLTFLFVTPRMEQDTLRQWREKAKPSELGIRDRVSLISPVHG